MSEFGNIKVIGNREMCCNDMKIALDEHFIGLGDYDNGSFVMPKNEIAINIYQCSPYPEGATWDDMPIQFCPFCGSKIIIEIIEILQFICLI